MKDKEARERLIEERERLLREIDGFEHDLAESLADTSEESPYDQHMAEAAAFTQERQMDLTLEESARQALARTEHALEKIDAGTYGVCDSCGEHINEGRLQIAPDSSLCIDCQRLLERGL